MPNQKTLRPIVLVAGFTLVFSLSATPAFAQQNQNGNTNGDAAAQDGSDAGPSGLSADEVFSGGIQRDGAVGESAGPVGASRSDDAGNANAGRGFGGLGGGFGGLGGAFGNLFGNNNQNNANSKPAIRTRLRSAVVPFPGQSTNPQQVADQRLRSARSVAFPSAAASAGNPFTNVRVDISGRTAVLRGSVRNDSDRRMSELLMRLEPGVSRVENQVRVSPGAASHSVR